MGEERESSFMIGIVIALFIVSSNKEVNKYKENQDIDRIDDD